jgi:hypothetical protein
VGQNAGVDAMEKRKNLTPAGNQPHLSSLWPIGIPTELTQLLVKGCSHQKVINKDC